MSKYPRRVAVLVAVLVVLLGGAAEAEACSKCRPLVLAGVYNHEFAANLLALMLPIAVLFLVGIGIHFSDGIKTSRAAAPRNKANLP